ncbi:MAG: hypothetical protein GY832_35750 [Chloroflexi bacterium]|nr:hypothetical protein [Chloroflexota bacterium]
MTTNSTLDSHAAALLHEQGYLTLPQYEQKAMLSHSAARRRLRGWHESGLLDHHFGQGAPRHYTAPDHPPMLGRDARWRLIVQDLLEQENFVDPVEYRGLVREQFSLEDNRTTGRDLAAWVQAGLLQRTGPHGQGSIYLLPDADPQTWTPKSQKVLDGRAFPLHRWVIARHIIQQQGHLTLALLAKQANVSIHTAQRDVNTWVTQGWLDRLGTGTHIYWRLPGQGPLADHAPDRSERVARIITELKETGALTAIGAAELNHCALAIARRDLNTAVLAGQAVRVRFRGIIWLSFPLPKSLNWADWGEPVLALARQNKYKGQEELLEEWQWNALSKSLPVTAREAAKIWAIGAATARQRLAVLTAAGIVTRKSGGQHKPDRFEKID